MSRNWNPNSSILIEPLLDNEELAHDRQLLSDDDERDVGLFQDVETDEARPFITTGPSGLRTRWQPRWARGTKSRWQALRERISSPRFRLSVERPVAVIFLLAVINFSLVVSGLLLMMPMYRLIEDAFCHEHYGKPLSEPIDEKECKGEEVQSKLAFMGGLGMLISAVATMLVAFPYGILADRIGRKPVLLICYTGIIFGFGWGPLILLFSEEPPIWLMLIGSVLFLIGGGFPVALNTLYAMASDLSSDKDRASNFLYLSIGAVLGALMGPAAAGVLMEAYSPWVPVYIVFAIFPVVITCIFLLPETLRVKLGDDDQPGRPQPPFKQSMKENMQTGLKDLRTALTFLRDRNIRLCIVPTLIGNALFASGTSTLGQYVSKHFGWSLAQSSYLLSPLNFFHLAVLAVLPRVSARLVDPQGRFRLSALRKDLLLVRASYFFLGLSNLVQGMSPNIALFLTGLLVASLGSAAGPLGRAVVTEFVDKEQTSRLYAMLSIVDMLGSFIGGPVLAWCFTAGMERGGVLKGLHFFYLSFLCVCGLAAFALVREPKRPKATANAVSDEIDDEGLGYESAPEDG